MSQTVTLTFQIRDDADPEYVKHLMDRVEYFGSILVNRDLPYGIESCSVDGPVGER